MVAEDETTAAGRPAEEPPDRASEHVGAGSADAEGTSVEDVLRRARSATPEERERFRAQLEEEFTRATALRERLREFGIHLRTVDHIGYSTKEERAGGRGIPWEQGFVTIHGVHGTQFTLAMDDLERLLAMIGPHPGGEGGADGPGRDLATPAEGGPSHDVPPS